MLPRGEDNYSSQSQSLIFLFLYSVYWGSSSAVFPEEIIIPSDHDNINNAAIAAQIQRQPRWKVIWRRMKELTDNVSIDVVLKFFVASLVLLLSISFLGYCLYKLGETIFGATQPCISLGSFVAITPLNITYAKAPSANFSSSTVTGSWNVSFGYYNRGHEKITYYDAVNITLQYQDALLGNSVIRIHDLQQGKGQTWLNLSTRIDANLVQLDDLLAYTFARDMNDKTIKYTMEVVTQAFIQPNWWFGKKVDLYHDIDDTSDLTTWCPVEFPSIFP